MRECRGGELAFPGPYLTYTYVSFVEPRLNTTLVLFVVFLNKFGNIRSQEFFPKNLASLEKSQKIWQLKVCISGGNSKMEFNTGHPFYTLHMCPSQPLPPPLSLFGNI